jgi:hypothetical protein
MIGDGVRVQSADAGLTERKPATQLTAYERVKHGYFSQQVGDTPQNS